MTCLIKSSIVADLANGVELQIQLKRYRHEERPIVVRLPSHACIALKSDCAEFFVYKYRSLCRTLRGLQALPGTGRALFFLHFLNPFINIGGRLNSICHLPDDCEKAFTCCKRLSAYFFTWLMTFSKALLTANRLKSNPTKCCPSKARCVFKAPSTT